MDLKKRQKTRTIKCKDNGRSSDAVSANFVLGCYNKSGIKPCSYCYVDRWNRKKMYFATNPDDILNECDKWVQDKPWKKIPNQVGKKYYWIDIGCSADVNFTWKDYDWVYVFDWFKQHPKLAATFATKFVNSRLLEYSPEGKIRCRMSLSPQCLVDKLEKGTSPIIKRISFIPKLINAGYEAHINLSPVVVYKEWWKDYIKLFKQLSELDLTNVKLEVIFLTHHEETHYRNLELWSDAEELLWKPEWQEVKRSQYGGVNVRYKHQYKSKLVAMFKRLVDDHLGLEIRYIF